MTNTDSSKPSPRESSAEKAIFHAAHTLTDAAMRAEYLDIACQNNHLLRRRIELLLEAVEDDGRFMSRQAIHLVAVDPAVMPEGERSVDGRIDEMIVRNERASGELLDDAGAHDWSLGRRVESLAASIETERCVQELSTEDSNDTTIEPAADLLVGQTLGHYHVLELIGSGGMGRVYLAEDPRLDRKVALKIIPALQIGEGRSRFIHEARLASAIDHANVCAIHDIGESAEWCFIAMQYIEGQTLTQLIGSRPLALNTLLPIAIQVADGLRAAHQRGITHRDIATRNIMVNSQGVAKVLDFGLAKLLVPESPHSVRTERVAGTPCYMSPEQARGGPVDCRSDIYAFGAVLFHMATGTVPFRGESNFEVMQAVIAEAHMPPRKLNPDIPPELAAIIDRALAKSPEDRYQAVDEMASDLRSLLSQPPLSYLATPFKKLRQPLTLAAVTAVFVTIAIGWFVWQSVSLRWAQRQVLTIEQLVQEGRPVEAYQLAGRVRRHLPDDPKLTRLMPGIANTLSVTSKPTGARVYLKRFDGGDSASSSSLRLLLGTTPLIDKEIARTDYVVCVEKEGHARFQRTLSGATVAGLEKLFPPIQLDVTLIPSSEAPTGMVYVPGGEYRLVAWRRPTEAKVRLDGYFIDACEVTNREYKEFIDAGGYLQEQFWTEAFVEQGSTILREEAMPKLVDRTGLPAPRGWSHQQFPVGRGDHPVTGVTWYEAVAYAAFRGKTLPTIFQWEKASRDGGSSPLGLTMPWGLLQQPTEGRANFASEGTVPVGSLEFGMSPFGCYDTAGNVAEWCANATSDGYITSGASWADLGYEFGRHGTRPGIHNSDRLGFRCVWNPAGTGDQGEMWIDLYDEIPRYTAAPEEQVKTWLANFDYTKTSLASRVVATLETDEWRRETVEFDGGNGRRVQAFLYIPRRFTAPYQVIQFVPAGDIWFGLRTLPQSIEADYAQLIRSGRAIFAINDMKGPATDCPPKDSVEFVDAVAEQIVDLRRGLDYLETRRELNASQIAFLQSSAGGYPLILPAIDSRLRTVIIWGGGYRQGGVQNRKEVNLIHYAPLIRVPKLIIHGRYDETTPLRTEAEPFFRLLPEPKHIVLFEGGHRPDAAFLTAEVSVWLDTVFGPVRPRLSRTSPQ